MLPRKPRNPKRRYDLPQEVLQRTLDFVKSRAYFNPLVLDKWRYRRARYLAPGQYERLDAKWGAIRIGEMWGGEDVTAFFNKTVRVPDPYVGHNVVLDMWLDGGEAQLKVNARPWQGLDWHRWIVPLTASARPGERFTFDVEAFVNNIPYDDWRGDVRANHTFARATLFCRDRQLEDFCFDAQFALETYLSYWERDDNVELEELLLAALRRACAMIDLQERSPAVTRRQVSAAHGLLSKEVFRNPLFRHSGSVSICGQSHLDIIYLWPIKETIRKNGRTNTNALSLMREFPEFKFTQSQPWLYEQLKQSHPSVYAEIKDMVRAGRWEVIGGTYVEPDGNLLGGESWVRQILFGKRFWRKEFGVETHTCWMPDVFGVCHTLPQILAKSGLKYFMTIKQPTWNDTNDFPHDTFWWEGPDGSRVLAHFPPTHFGELLSPGLIRRHWADYRHKTQTGESLLAYGWADGGGGPTREMVAASIRAARCPGVPRCRIEFAEAYFRRIEKKASQLPVWNDELYLECHRGTYTSRADLKRRNRQAEVLYHNAEFLAAAARLFGGPSEQDRLNEGWKLILLNQFHDTLTGTHVDECVPDTDRDYEKVFAIGRDVRDRAACSLLRRIRPLPDGRSLCVFNSLSWDRADLVSVEASSNLVVRDAQGTALTSQYHDGRLWFWLPRAPSLGWTTVSLGERRATHRGGCATFKRRRLRSSFFDVTFTPSGCIQAILDRRTNREVLDSPGGNLLQVFEDNPGRRLNAWDILPTFEQKEFPVTLAKPWKMTANGPCFAVVSGAWRVLNSTIWQDIILYSHLPRIDFRTRADWQDPLRLLKVGFHLAVRSRTATYDMPFGNIERPTYRNTSWDTARFEVCAHRWADLSEGDYGVALLNDCKYGCDARDNRLRLTLIKSPTHPHPASDIGRHEFAYAIFPHRGGWRDGGVDRAGYEFNVPLLTCPHPGPSDGNPLPPECSLFEVDKENVIIETVKESEDGSGIVIRPYDNRGCRGRVRLRSHLAFGSIRECNPLEEPQSAPVKAACQFDFPVGPYEIKTFKIAVPPAAG